MNSSGQEINVPSNTLFDELSCLKLEEVTHDKEKYRHKYKSVKKDLVNVSTKYILYILYFKTKLLYNN